MAKRKQANETAPANAAPSPADIDAAAALRKCVNCGYAREDHVLHDSGYQRCPVMWRGLTFYR